MLAGIVILEKAEIKSVDVCHFGINGKEVILSKVVRASWFHK